MPATFFRPQVIDAPISREQFETQLQSRNIRYAAKDLESQPTGNNSFLIDIDGDLVKEEIFLQAGPRFALNYSFLPQSPVAAVVHQGHLKTRSVAYRFSEGATLSESFSQLPALKSIRVYVGDLDNDGFEDFAVSGFDDRDRHVIIGFNNVLPTGIARGLFITLSSETLADSPNKFILVPEYERAGTVHTSSQIASDERTYAPKNRLTFLESIGASPELKSALPSGFLVGQKRSSNSLGPSLKEKLESYGFRVSADIDAKMSSKNSYEAGVWPQDKYEAFVDATTGQNFDLPLNMAEGGSVQPVRNRFGEDLLTVQIWNIEKGQESLFKAQGKIVSYDDAKKIYALGVGLRGDQILPLPIVDGYQHLDQQIVFFEDGKAIAVKLPRSHPDYERWELAKDEVRGRGFEIVDVELPEYHIRNSRSPLNMVMGEINGENHYVIPLDPIVLFDPSTRQYVDLRNPSQNAGFSENQPGSFALKGDLITFYDLGNLPPHILKIKQTLKDAGIPEERIHVMPYHGTAGGSIHCRTNIDPL